jgi:hypothetical protein
MITGHGRVEDKSPKYVRLSFSRSVVFNTISLSVEINCYLLPSVGPSICQQASGGCCRF